MRNFMTGPGLVTNGLEADRRGSPRPPISMLKTAVFMHSNDTFGTAQSQAMGRSSRR